MKKLLLVEDEPEIRAVLREIAETIPFHVTEAENGAIGLEKLKQDQYDLIISDVRMPFKDGLQLLKDFRSLNKETPFYILTAFDDISEHQIYLLKGNGVFYKPVNVDALKEFFERHN
jgi:YesN/AraC family two-component response regulator